MPATKHPLLEAFTKNPLLIDAASVDLVASSLALLATDEAAKAGFNMQIGSDDFWGRDEHPYRPYVVHNGVLQIPVQGVLLNRFSYQFGRWATGYPYVERALARGLADPEVKAIALICDSPGGDVAGCFELSDKIHAARSEKPIRAFAADHAYSAAYALASSASDVVVSRSGGTGSVGVVTAHTDMSKMLEDWGIKITFIFAGKHKVDGNSYEALPDEVKGRIQERIDRIYSVFVDTVARNRNMDAQSVRDTEALTYDATDSVSQGFADRVGALDEEMVVFANETAGETEDEQMSFTQEQMDAAVAAARADGMKAGKQEGLTEGATVERERVNAIMTSDEGKARPKAARAMADAGIAADAAKVALAAMPEEKAESTTPAPKGKSAPSGFERAMADGNPEVGATVETNDDEGNGDDPQAFADSFFARIGKGKRPAAN